jgi:hypothetical protein
MMPRMRIMTGLAGWALAGVLMLTGCAPKQGPVMQGDSPKLGVLSRVEDPAAVAGARSFYVQPNSQLSMSNSFVAGTSLQQVFADRIAGDLVKRGLTQGPPDMADMTVVYTVHDPSQTTPAAGSGSTQGLAYADQLLSEARAMQTKDNFLDADRLDMRIKMVANNSRQVIWRGSIAGVLSAGEDTRGRLLDPMDAVDRLLAQYPKVAK